MDTTKEYDGEQLQKESNGGVFSAIVEKLGVENAIKAASEVISVIKQKCDQFTEKCEKAYEDKVKPLKAEVEDIERQLQCDELTYEQRAALYDRLFIASQEITKAIEKREKSGILTEVVGGVVFVGTLGLKLWLTLKRFI